MRYEFPILVTVDTPKILPVRYRCKLVLGDLVKVSVYFPWGCAGLAGVRILHYEHQLYPTNLDEWFIGNEIQIEFACAYPIREGRNQFYVEAYNLDDFYSHTPIVSFDVMPTGTLLTTFSAWLEG